jgi:hypothetical protein
MELRVIAPTGHVDGVKMVVTEQTSRRRVTQKGKKPGQLADHPAFGMWADREDMKDVHAWLKKIRAPRYDRLGRRQPRP